MTTRTLTPFDLVPGKTLLDRYRITGRNRQGSMSSTFAVEDLEESAPREVQLFPAALFERKEQAAEFAESMEAWTRVDSAHVARVHDVVVQGDSTILLVTDLPPARSLREAVPEGRSIPPAQARQLGLQLLDALMAIHAAGLVHGDVKPRTIFVADERLTPVLVDGGITPALWIAKHLGDKTALIGTPFYAPVEQFGGESPTVQSDVYNVATVLYELLTGVLPWQGKSFLEIFQAKLQKVPPAMRKRAPESTVPDDLERAVAGGLMADTNERYASAGDFRRVLATVKGL